MSHLRDRRAFGNIGTRKFRGARYGDALSPRFTGLLDTYTGASGAYAFIALTRNWLAGDVVRARRVNTPALANFTANQVANGELATWALSGDAFVHTFFDQSGNGDDWTQGTSTAQPKIVSAGVLVTDGMTLDGVNDHMTSSVNYSADMSVFMVSNINQDNGSDYQRILYTADGSDSLQITRAGSSESYEILSKNTAFQASTDAFKHGVSPTGLTLITTITSATTTAAFVDSASTTNTATILGAGNNVTSTLGSRDNLTASTFFKGTITAIIIYPSNQSANRTGIEAIINAAYPSL